ncbi:MAG: hypothetical protein ABW167_21710 [Baekduia sp.]
MTSAARWLAVRFEETVWQEAIRGFSREPLQIAMSARRVAERHGIALADVYPCEAIGSDGTQLVGCAKLYLPVGDGPPSERPMAFVASGIRQRTKPTEIAQHRQAPVP